MPQVRGFHMLALLLAVVLAVAGVLVTSTMPAAAATPQTVAGHIEDGDGNPVDGVEVIVADGIGTFYPGTTDASGSYSIGVPDVDWYTVAAGSDEWVWQYTDPEIYVDGSQGPVDFTLEPGVAISGVVTDIADNTFVGDVEVFAIPLIGTPPFTPAGMLLPVGYFDFHGPTDASDGAYSITVPLNDDYALLASDENDDYDAQLYLGHNVSGCICDPDLVSIGTTAPATPTNFQLYGFVDWVHVSVYAVRDPVPDDFDGLLVTLQRKNTGTGLWDDVTSATTGSSGTVDLYGPGAGEYRIVYSESGTALAATSAEDDYTGTPYGLSESGRALEFGTLTPPTSGGGGCGCGGPGAFTEEIVDMVFPAAASGGGSGGGGGATKPPSPRHTTISSLIGTITPTPTPTPTPTSTPTPSSSPTAQPEESPTPTPQPVPAGDTGFPWWIILIFVLAIGIIVTIIVLLRRR